MNRESGDLTLIDKVAVPGTEKPSPSSMPTAVSPNRRFLYAALRSEPFPVSRFAIDPNSGRLTHLATAPLKDSMAYIVTDRSGRFLLSASYPGSKLTINPIDDKGLVMEKTTQIILNKPKAHCILVDPTNRYSYATSLGNDVVTEWKFDPVTGTLSPNGPGEVYTKPGAGPRHLALHPNRRFLYVITETTDTIGAYAIDPASGTLTELQFVDALPPNFKDQPAAADLHVTPARTAGFFMAANARRAPLSATASTPTKARCRRSGTSRPRRRRAASTSTPGAASCSRSDSIRTE
jgi:6-phosphogluconolactonase